MVSDQSHDDVWLDNLPNALRAPALISHDLQRLAPEFVKGAEHCLDLRAFLDAVNRSVGNQQRKRAISELNNNVTNDWLDLITDALSGRGRGALRSARSLFEASLVIGPLLADQALADRFVAHKSISALSLSSLSDDLALRSSKSRRSVAKARQRWRQRWEPEAEEALGLYGKKFAQGWDEKSVRQRAIDGGREAEYDAFRLASATVHGSSGAVIGTLLEYPDDTPVHRMGPNLMMCPTAVLYGSRSFLTYLKALSDDGFDHASDVAERVNHLLSLWVTYEAALARIDAEIWPREAPERLRLVAVVEPSDIYSFYIHDVDSGTAIRARPASDSLWVRTRADEFVADLRARHPHRSVRQTVAFIGATGVPAADAAWLPAADVFPDLMANLLPVTANSQIVTLDGVYSIDESGHPWLEDDAAKRAERRI